VSSLLRFRAPLVVCPEGKALLLSDDPFRDFNILTKHFKPFQFSNVSISSTAVIE
jgi:UDP-3-O-[3-hydroxymyristoyl] glucosamine N-acyltransferase